MVDLNEKEILDLIEEAIETSKKAYVKYSEFPVGAVLIDENNKKFKGVNFENASYGLSICAERNVIGTAVTEGMRKIKTLIVTGDTEGPISPCGACRQVILEFADENTVIILSNYKKDYKIVGIDDLLPYSFKL